MNGKSEQTPKKTLVDKVFGLLPPWFAAAREVRSWKTWARCMVALFVAIVLLLDPKTLNTEGQAAFFSMIIAFILPPSMALGLYIVAVGTLLIGMCIGWAWGIAAMAAGLRARSQVLLQSQIENVQKGYNTQANLDAQFQLSVFHGDFLDPRSSAVFGVFLFVGTYTLGYLRATKPRLIFLSIFGSICMDIMCSYGPLFPVAQYSLAKILILPGVIYVAIAMVCTVLIFPQSLNHVVLTALVRDTIKPLKAQLELQHKVLESSPSDPDKVGELAGKATTYRTAHAAAIQGIGGQIPLLQLEITRGQIGAKDMHEIYKQIKELAGYSFVLLSFILLLNQDHKVRAHIAEDDEQPTAEACRLRLEREQDRCHPGTTLDELFAIVSSSTSDIRKAVADGLDGAINWLEVVNHSRWTKPPANTPDMTSRENNLAVLREALRIFRQTKQHDVLDPYHDLFDDKGAVKPESQNLIEFSARNAFRCHIYTTGIINFAECLVSFLELLLRIERENPKARFQLPSAFSKMLVKSLNHKTATNPLEIGTDLHHTSSHDSDTSSETLVDEPQEKKGESSKKYPLDPDAEDPRNIFQRLGRFLAGIVHEAASPQGLFALKYGIASIALWIPQVCPSSAYFVYSNRGLWALIMAQTGLGIFAGEQISTFIVRIIGTIIGLVVGMVIWYVGAPGNTKGNPYGIAASAMVFLSPLMLIRVIVPLRNLPMWLLAGVTSVFVLGYSWLDNHIYETANEGAGAPLAGRRALLVIIGFATAFIVMLFPRPLSSRQVVRQNFSKCIDATGELYMEVLEGVEKDSTEVNVAVKRDEAEVKQRSERSRGKYLGVLAQLQGIGVQMNFAGFEPGIRGPWPKKKYQALFASETTLVSALALFGVAQARLTTPWAKRLERSHLINPAFVADCLARFALLSQSLETARPLPLTIPIMERMAYHRDNYLKQLRRPGTTRSSTNSSGTSDARNGDALHYQEVEDMQAKQALANLGQPLTWDLAHDEQMAVFATATTAMTYVVVSIQEVQRAIVSLVGETTAAGLSQAQERWSRMAADLQV